MLNTTPYKLWWCQCGALQNTCMVLLQDGGGVHILFSKKEKLFSHLSSCMYCTQIFKPHRRTMWVHTGRRTDACKVCRERFLTSRSSIGDKVTCYWEHIGEQTRNLMNNGWKPIKNFDRNTLGTWWEHIGNRKNPKSSTSPTLSKMKKKKTLGLLGACDNSSIGWREIFSSSPIWPRLIGKGMNCGNVTQGAFTLGIRDSKAESSNIMLLPI